MTLLISEGSDEALSAALAAEHAAIFAYGPIGVRLAGAAAAEAHAAEASHRSRRDALVLVLVGAGVTPPPAAASYAMPEPVTDPVTAMRVATTVEERTAAVWRSVLPVTTAGQRRDALAALTDCSVRATRWRKFGNVTPLTVPFPGRTP
jgi:hypothetical protein